MNELEEMRQRLFDYEMKMIEAQERNARWETVIKSVEVLWRTALVSADVRRFKAALKAMKRGSLEGMEKAMGIEVKR